MQLLKYTTNTAEVVKKFMHVFAEEEHDVIIVSSDTDSEQELDMGILYILVFSRAY